MNRPQAIRAKLLSFEDEMACFIVAVLAAMQFFLRALLNLPETKRGFRIA